ncbi:hypothetical protein SEA_TROGGLEHUMPER_21 [Rhodococcus phage Trogglehumper]|uniref:Uncharacterized protein n=1 Tax=Rhodococcus phage Trogglehumper TaxID=3038381 RepID=A0AAF0GJ14_9CAUD|nr:hypothetical protein SEA_TROGGLEHUMPER_21 [Rhodococcus phage Trogglehumper]
MKLRKKYLKQLKALAQTAKIEVENSDYFGFDSRLYGQAIEGGLGGDVGKFAGAMTPDVVVDLVDTILGLRQLRDRVHTLTRVHAGEYTSLADWMSSDAPQYHYSLHTQEPQVLDIAKERDAQITKNAELVSRTLELEGEVAHWREVAELNKDAFETSNETVKTSGETNRGLIEERTGILQRIMDWERVYQAGDRDHDDLTLRIAALINGYGSLYQSVVKANNVLKSQNDELDAFRELGASPETVELLREVDVLGAYLKYPARENETETRLEIVKAALTKVEEQDELIGTLQRALVAAQSGQPRRPEGFKTWAKSDTEPVDPPPAEPLPTWDERLGALVDGAAKGLIKHMLDR